MGTQLASASPASPKRKLAAHFVEINVSTASNCGYVTGVEFARVPKAISYTIRYYDGYYKTLETVSDTPAQLKQADAQYASYLPRGENFLPVTGGYSSPPCGTFTPDPTDGGRFSKGAKAWVVLPRFKLSGQVLTERCTKSSCTKKPHFGVTVVAKPVGSGSGGQATTGKDGRYSIELQPGSYDVSLRGVKGIPPVQHVTLNSDFKDVDFRTCASSAASDMPSRLAVSPPFVCYFIVKVTLRDLAGNGVEGAEVYATNALSPTMDFLGFDGPEATTNSQGVATLDLYEQHWEVYFVTNLDDVLPFLAGGSQAGTWDYEMTQCQRGVVKHPSYAPAACSLDLEVGHGLPRPLHMDATAALAPVDISRFDRLVAFTSGAKRIYQHRDVPRATHQRFELPLRDVAGRPDGPWEIAGFDEGGTTTRADPIATCSPGHATTLSVDPPWFGYSKLPVCRLAISASDPNGHLVFGQPK